MAIRLNGNHISFDDGTAVPSEWYDQIFGQGAFPTGGTSLTIKSGSTFTSGSIGSIETPNTPTVGVVTTFLLEFSSPGSITIPSQIDDRIYVWAVGGGGGTSGRGDGGNATPGGDTIFGTENPSDTPPIDAGGGTANTSVNNSAPLNIGGPGGVASGGQVNVNGGQGGAVFTTAQAGTGGTSGQGLYYGFLPPLGGGQGGAGAPPAGGSDRFGAGGSPYGGGGGGGYFAGPPTGSDTRAGGGGGGALVIHSRYGVSRGTTYNYQVGTGGNAGSAASPGPTSPLAKGAPGFLRIIFYKDRFEE